MIIKKKLQDLFELLWPLNRTLSNRDTRKSHSILKKINKFQIIDFKSNSKVYDWKIPKEWNIKRGYIKFLKSNKFILNFKENNLHVASYSQNVNKTLSLGELKKKIISSPKQKKAIPYVTNYYKNDWNFCMSEIDKQKLKPGKYKVLIDVEKKKKNFMPISHKVIPGVSKKEILFQSYLCHPSLAVNELVGPIILSYMSKFIHKMKNRYYTYRLVLAPETIGSIAYIHKYEKTLKKNLLAGYIITCFGRSRKYILKQSRKIDGIENKLCDEFFNGHNFKKINYSPYGSDERQYNSLGLKLPVSCIMSEIPGKYFGYHTSLDNISKINFEIIKKNIKDFCNFIKFIEKKRFVRMNSDKCEPHMSKHFNFYGTIKNLNITPTDYTKCLKWICHFADGEHTLQDISNLSKIKLSVVKKIFKLMQNKKLVNYL